MGEGGLWFLLTYQCTSRPDLGIKALLLTLHEACEKFLQCVQFIFLYKTFSFPIFPFHQACIMDQTRPLAWQCTPWHDLGMVTEFKLCWKVYSDIWYRIYFSQRDFFLLSYILCTSWPDLGMRLTASIFKTMASEQREVGSEVVLFGGKHFLFFLFSHFWSFHFLRLQNEKYEKNDLYN